jgi:hypothetical protein
MGAVSSWPVIYEKTRLNARSAELVRRQEIRMLEKPILFISLGP